MKKVFVLMLLLSLMFVLGCQSDIKTGEDIMTEEGFYRTLPATAGEKAAIARARQLTEFTFTPLRDIPTMIKKNTPGVFAEGEEVKGFPYSSCECNDKFLMENVSVETFLSAIANPDSVLYNKDIYWGSNASTYYGIVCNGFVRYCFGITQRCNTMHWLDLPGMIRVADEGSYTVDEIKLCDVLYAYGKGRNHVALITDILKDEAGKIVKVEVSEAVRPTCKRRSFEPEAFYENYKLFSLCRYEYLDSVPPLDKETDNLLFNSGIDKRTPDIAVDYGNKSNYLEGEKTIISVFKKGNNTVKIIKDGEIIETVEVSGRTKLERKLDSGYYEIALPGSEDKVEFAVCRAEVKHTVDSGTITIYADSCDDHSEIVHMDFRMAGGTYSGISQLVELTEEEIKSGEITRKIPGDAHNYKIYFKNKYGIWTHSNYSIW